MLFATLTDTELLELRLIELVLRGAFEVIRREEWTSILAA